MSKLTTIQAKRLCKQAELFAALRHHRTLIVEPLRQVAVRNLRFVARLMQDLRASLGEATLQQMSTEEYMTTVHRRILAEQRRPNHPLASTWLDVETIGPFELYLLAMSEQYKFLEMHVKSGDFPEPPELARLRENYQEFFEQIAKLRDAVIHPAVREYGQQLRNIVYQRADLQVEYIQSRMDLCSEWIRASLSLSMNQAVKELPSKHALLCRLLSLGDIDSDFTRENDLTSLDALSGVSSVVISRTKELSKGTPQCSDHESRVAGRIGRALWYLYAFNPIMDETFLPEVQPATDRRVFDALVGAAPAIEGYPASQPTSRAAVRVATNFRGYFQLFQRAMTIKNEWFLTVHRQGSLDPHFWPAEVKVIVSGLGRVADATLVPILQDYLSVRIEEESLRVPFLEELVEDEIRLKSLLNIRKEVFHVGSPVVSPEKFGSIEQSVRMYGATAEFLTLVRNAFSTSETSK